MILSQSLGIEKSLNGGYKKALIIQEKNDELNFTGTKNTFLY